ncbi:PH domain-containing protein [Caldimonas manganoxidans]|uniref:PH domain-containing protein n=1 Tax=Caldimonas manganoxidans TaxID=196015 RepID=UPI00035CD6FC|nr:PH domain-containing protein [Caldimonas manganoxidans]
MKELLVGMLAAVALAALLEVGVIKALRGVQLAASPLSGEGLDSFVYDRSLLTPQRDLAIVWAGLILAGVLGACAWVFDRPGLWVPAGLAWCAALGWDWWTWERAAASVKSVSWRRGWRHSTRRVPVSRVAEVHVVEKRWLGPLGTCYIALTLDDGKAVKLPHTATLGGLSRVEDVANFIRLQIQQVRELQQRRANERRRARARREPKDPQERELRRKLVELRRAQSEKAQ